MKIGNLLNRSIANKVENIVPKEVNSSTLGDLTSQFKLIIAKARGKASGALDLGYSQKLFKELCEQKGVDPNRFWNVYRDVMYNF